MAMSLNPRGVPNKVLYGSLCPKVQPLTPLRTSVTKGIDKWDPFHIPCIELRTPFNCRKCSLLKDFLKP